jgi:1-acyl-sn-glycerol-3-phosphate acyltransferase
MLKHFRKPRGLQPHAWVITRVVRTFMRSIAKVRIVRVKVDNRKNVPRSGRVIVAPNHISFADPVYLWGSLPRNAVAIAKAELWRVWGLNLLLKLMGMIPINRGNAESAQKTLDAGERILENDGLLVIFPEGKCSKTGELLPFKHGMVTMAMRTNSPILPAGIIGTEKVAPLGSKRIRWWKKVRVCYGTLVYPADFTGPDAHERMTAAVRRQVLRLSGAIDSTAQAA